MAALPIGVAITFQIKLKEAQTFVWHEEVGEARPIVKGILMTKRH